MISGITRGYQGLQADTRDNKEIPGGNKEIPRIKGDTRDNKGIPGITRGYQG